MLLLLALLMFLSPIESEPIVETVLETRIIYQVMKPNETVYRYPRSNGDMAILVDGDNYPDSTIESVNEFLEKDTTRNNEYVLNEYQCTDYAVDLHNNAERAGFMAGVVHIDSENGGHAITVFATREGWYFVDNRGNGYRDITDAFDVERYSITW